jgi:hypothetical protein
VTRAPWDAVRRTAAHPLVRVVAVALLQYAASRLAEPSLAAGAGARGGDCGNPPPRKPGAAPRPE